MNGYTYHDQYRFFQLKRDSAIHDAEQHRLAVLAATPPSEPASVDPATASTTRKPGLLHLHLAHLHVPHLHLPHLRVRRV